MKRFKIFSTVIALLTAIFMLTSCGGSGGWGEPQPADESLPEFNTSCLPLTVTDGESYGNFAFDGNGNLLFHVIDTDEIRSLNRSTCVVTTIATNISVNATGSKESDFIGMTYHDGSIYVGGYSGNIYEVDQATGNSTLLTTISGEYLNGLVIAPATFSPYGGQLIVATYSGRIYAVDQSAVSPAPVQFAYTGTDISALVFDSNGTLYLADWYNNKILTLTTAGVVSDFVTTGLDFPDGLAFGNNVLYVSNDSSDISNGKITSVTIPGGVVSDITSVAFNGGWYPSPIIYDATSNILLFSPFGPSGALVIDYYTL